jgi:hypothetical protein
VVTQAFHFFVTIFLPFPPGFSLFKKSSMLFYMEARAVSLSSSRVPVHVAFFTLFIKLLVSFNVLLRPPFFSIQSIQP